jgi:hypothetical protein
MKVLGLFRVALVATAVVFVVVGVIYLLTECRHLPPPLPGRVAGSTDHRFGFAAAAFTLAAFTLGAGAFGRRSGTR